MSRTQLSRSTRFVIAASVLAGVVILGSAPVIVPGCKKKAPPPPADRQAPEANTPPKQPTPPRPPRPPEANVPAVVKPVLPTTMPALPATMPAPPMNLTFQCEKCAHQFSVPLEEMSDDPDAMAELEFSVRDCPSCGAKKSCWLTIQCPTCKKHYISQSVKVRLQAMRQGRTGPEGIQDVCPHCGTNLLEWYYEHRKR